MRTSLLKRYFSRAYLSRIIILGIDISFVTASIIAAHLLRFNMRIPEDRLDLLPLAVMVVVGVKLLTFKFFRTYSGIIRFTGEQDVKRLVLALTIAMLLLGTGNAGRYLSSLPPFVPFSILVIDYVMSVFLLGSYRIAIKILYNQFLTVRQRDERVVIFGAGQSGLITKRAIYDDGKSKMRVVGFFDDNPNVHDKIMEGVTIYNPHPVLFRRFVRKHKVKTAIISIQVITEKRKQEIIDLCLRNDLNVKVVPSTDKWIHGEFSANQIKGIKIEDLLNRDPIVLDMENIRRQIAGKTVMITGAAGSIGSEIARQLMRFNPQQMVLIDQAESPLVELQLELEERHHFRNIAAVMADVASRARMEAVFKVFQPDIIYHAAAYKHVPMMEEHPAEAIRVNVLGTKNLADLAVAWKVKKFIMISTDKAVNPTNVMGASKRIAEIYAQALFKHAGKTQTRFITTRFGNVLGSNGSVIPRFKKQIEAGGPITVTHPDITRYFMTIPEACQLVLEAGAMGQGGEIFIFDMGKSVKITDLANNMIKLSGLVPGKDIQIVYTGLRPGEKIKEELLNNSENVMPTHHEKIMIAQVREYSFAQVDDDTNNLIALLASQNPTAIVQKMKAIVPEFISNNSVYSSLDARTPYTYEIPNTLETKPIQINKPG